MAGDWLAADWLAADWDVGVSDADVEGYVETAERANTAALDERVVEGGGGDVNTYTKGTRLELSAVFKTKAGENFDPAVVRFLVRAPGVDPDDAQVYSSPANPELGAYFVEISLTAQGRWRWRAEAEYPAATPWAADERVFEVERSGFD